MDANSYSNDPGLIAAIKKITSSPYVDMIRDQSSIIRSDALILFNGVQSSLNKLNNNFRHDTLLGIRTVSQAFATDISDIGASILKDASIQENQTKSLKIVRLNASDSFTFHDIHEISIDYTDQYPIGSILSTIAVVLGSVLPLGISTTLYCPSVIKELNGKSKKCGPRIFVSQDPINLVLNHAATWLCGHPVYGDVIISNCNIEKIQDFRLNRMIEIIHCSMPSQLWKANLGDIHQFPYEYNENVWNIETEIVRKKPIDLLREFIERKTNGNRLIIEKSLVRLDDIVTQIEETIEETIPNGWWTDETDKSIVTNECKKKMIDINPREYHMLKVIVPTNNVLYNASGLSYVTIYPLNPSEKPTEDWKSIKLVDLNQLKTENKEIIACNTSDGVDHVIGLKVLNIIEDDCRHILFNFSSRLNSITQQNLLNDFYRIKLQLTMKMNELSKEAISTEFSTLLGANILTKSIESVLLNIILHPNFKTNETIEVNNLTAFDIYGESSHILIDNPLKIIQLSIKIIETEKIIIKSKIMKPRLFNPPLAEQRRVLVQSIINKTNAKIWIDIGCGNGSYLSNVIEKCHNLQQIIGFDIQINRLLEASKIMENKLENYSKSLKLIKLYEISILNENTLNLLKLLYKKFDVISIMEVIEHLNSIEMATIAIQNILKYLKPNILIISTPNYEANCILTKESSIQITDQFSIVSINESINEMKSNNKIITIQTNQMNELNDKSEMQLRKENDLLRENDHKFEFTRIEFINYLNELLINNNNNFQYNYELLELGNQLNGMNITGGATQVAILHRQGKVDETNEIDSENAMNENETTVPCVWEWNKK